MAYRLPRMTTPLPPRLHLSPPDVGETEKRLLLEAFASNWIAPVGPNLDAFERAFERHFGPGVHCVATASGTAALHLGLKLLGVEPGDRVVVPTFTFAASAFAATYCGAEPVFVDSDPVSWTLDPALVERAIVDAQAAGQRVRAIVAVDIYGRCADYAALRAIARKHGVALLQDAAEAVGSTWGDEPAGRQGDLGVLSFNGNKILTTGGGGMLVCPDAALAKRARYLAAQARADVCHYEHAEVGYNYRLCNLNAAIGHAQLQRLRQLLAARAETAAHYRDALGPLPGLSFAPPPPHGRGNHWLTTVLVAADSPPGGPLAVLEALAAENIETRPLWKPMHLQPVFAGAATFGGGVCEHLYATGLCLPSGSGLVPQDRHRVCRAIHRVWAQ